MDKSRPITKRYMQAWGALYGNGVPPKPIKRKRRIKSTIPTEEQDQIALCDWARDHPVLANCFLHIENEAHTNGLRGQHANRKGRLKGVVDNFIPFPSGGYPGMWQELKRVDRSNHCTPEQTAWLELMKSFGYYTTVAYGFDEARQQIEAYLNIP